MIIKKHEGTIAEAVKTVQLMAEITGFKDGNYDTVNTVLDDEGFGIHLYIDQSYSGYDVYPEEGESLEHAYIDMLIYDELFTREFPDSLLDIPPKTIIAEVRAIMGEDTEEEVERAITRYLAEKYN